MIDLPMSPALSDFQKTTIRELATRPDFVRFHTVSAGFVDPEFGTRGPVTVLWSSRTGHIYAVRIGRSRIISEKFAKKGDEQ